MLSVRLKPAGKKHQRTFRVVVDRARHKLVGKDVEDLGWYNPHTDQMNFKADRVQYWLGVGAKPTDTVHNLLIRAGILKGKKVAVHAKSKKTAEETTEVAAPAAGTEAEKPTTTAPEATEVAKAPEATAETSKEEKKEE